MKLSFRVRGRYSPYEIMLGVKKLFILLSEGITKKLLWLWLYVMKWCFVYLSVYQQLEGNPGGPVLFPSVGLLGEGIVRILEAELNDCFKSPLKFVTNVSLTCCGGLRRCGRAAMLDNYCCDQLIKLLVKCITFAFMFSQWVFIKKIIVCCEIDQSLKKKIVFGN